MGMINGHPSYVIAAIGCVVNDDGKLLLARHAERGWEMPGGAVERGEDVLTALVREVQEETGYIVAVDYFIGMYFDLDHATLVLQFRCRPIASKPKEIVDSEEAVWFSEREVRDLIEREPGRGRLEDALAGDGRIVFRGFRSNPYDVLREEVWRSRW